MNLHSLPQGAVAATASDQPLASPRSAMRRVPLAVVVMAASISTHARADSIDAVMCARVGEVARLIATQRAAGVSEARMGEGVIKEVAGATLPGVLNIVHLVYSNPDTRHLSPDKTFELYRATCLAPFSVATVRSVGDLVRIG